MNVENIENPTLYEMKLMKEDYGLEGEEDTHQVVFLSFIKGGFVVMTGLSSGGKDETVDAAEYCVPDSWVFQVPTSLSKTDLYTKAMSASGTSNPNNCPVHRHKDISNISGKDWLEDIWKAHGDGRSISHSWTEVMGSERETRSATLYPPNCMVLFLASDNQQMDLNDYPEVRNRALVVSIDDSQSLTEQVNSRQAKQEAGIIDYNLTEDRTDEIREYVGTIPKDMYGGRSDKGGFINPVAVAIDDQNPLPQHFTEARRDFPRLMDFMKSVTLFKYDERMEVPRKEFPDDKRVEHLSTLLVTPEDAWLAMRVFGEKMVLSALNLQDKDFELLKILRRNAGQGMSVADLQQAMRSSGYNITPSDVRTSLDNMLTKGYVRKDQSSSPILYSSTPFATKANRQVNIDWPDIIEKTKETAYESLPDHVADDYVDQFCQGEGILVTHPFEGRTVNLMEQEANEVKQKAEDLEEAQADVAAGEGGDNEEEDGGMYGEAGKQGTLGGN
jgi:hypothetical protein